MVTKQIVLDIVGKDKERIFDEVMARHEPIIIGNEVHYPDDAVRRFLEKYDQQIMNRADGRIEWICEHGVGHTISVPKGSDDSWWVHGCDGCCKKVRR